MDGSIQESFVPSDEEFDDSTSGDSSQNETVVVNQSLDLICQDTSIEIISLLSTSSEDDNSFQEEEVQRTAEEVQRNNRCEVLQVQDSFVTYPPARPSVLAIFDPLHENNTCQVVQDSFVTYTPARPSVLALFDPLHENNTCEVVQNDHNVNTDMAGPSTKISYEELEKRLQLRENELLAKEEIIQQLQTVVAELNEKIQQCTNAELFF